MRKPGGTFAFEPKNNLASETEPQFPTSPKKKKDNQKTNQELRQSFYHLFQATTISFSPTSTSYPTSPTATMSRSRSASFGDDDLLQISSQQTNSQSPPSYTDLTATPAREIITLSDSPALNRNREVIDLANSPALAGRTAPAAAPSAAPAFGRPTNLPSSFNRKPVNIFNVPRNGIRVEHHRDHKDLYRVKGPLAPKIQGQKAAPPKLFSSVGPGAQPPTSPVKYSRAANELAYTYNEPAYTDPAKASADLKALLEGGMEDEEEEKKETIEDGTVEGIKVKLLPHQVEGIKWMRSREVGPIKKGKLPKGGILADDMGLGKTLQSVTLVVTNPLPKKDEEGWKDRFGVLSKGTLVVAPLALIRQWEAEIKDKITPDKALKVYVHHGPSRTKSARELMRYDVVITTYQILVSEHGNSSPDPDKHQAGCFGVHWYRVILDEAHSIKNRNAKATKACCALRAEYRWCLTGTPMQNNLDELQSLIHFLRVQPYDDLAEWRAHIDLPMKKGQGHIAIRRLHSLLRCFMKRRTKDVLKEEGALVAGGKKALDAAAAKAERDGTEYKAPKSAFKITERKVVTVATQFSPAEREFYDQLEARADKSIEKMMQGKVNYANALVLLLRLRQACNHPRLTEMKPDKDRDALAADQTAQQERKVAEADVDDLADMFGGMGIKAKQCEMCLNDLSRQEVADGYLRCSACVQSLDKLNNDTPDRKRPKKKGRRVSVVTEELKVQEKTRRKPRGRNIVMDSSDEEEEGSWLVGEDQRGSLRLGKSDGEDDEGVVEDIGSEDSDQSVDEDGSKLNSFVVNDEKNDSAVHSDEEETFLSVTKLHSQVVASQSQQSASGTSDSEARDSASDSDSDQSPTRRSNHRRRPKTGSGKKDTSSHVLQSAKIRELISILKKEVGEHKFIVFSQFTSMLDLIEPFFRAQLGFKFVRYDGGMKNDAREAALHSLRSDTHTRILLCSLKCGSLGLNLTAATRVVILEPFWNPFVEEQAIDRVHRLTQTVDVVVYKLTVADTVEERILELQNKKRLLAEATIEGGMRKKDKNALKLGLQEILALFKHRSSTGPEDNLPGQDDIGEVVRSMKNITTPRRKEKVEHQVYGRRW
ncbi:SNF2 family N-terminal domain-containing protein [Coniochaeta sp. 2T2.1]|nr:SNF2 family N-terminal domain-containing protein [Coniochaeta sp. 2T2.1]